LNSNLVQGQADEDLDGTYRRDEGDEGASAHFEVAADLMIRLDDI